jgi:hypothetical protein
MLRFKIKPKKIDEIKDDELEHIKDIISGDQFHNIFGDKQRIVVDLEPGAGTDISKAFSENEIDAMVATDIVETLERLVRKYSTENYKYSIDFGKGLLNREVKRVIPKGPRAGEEEIKKQIFKLSTLTEAIGQALESAITDETKKTIESLFPEVNQKSFFGFKQDVASDLSSRLYMSARNEVERIEIEENDIYRADKSDMTPPRELIKKIFGLMNEMSGDNVVIISRAPVDLLRMSDFPGDATRSTGIVSCHSPKRKTANGDEGAYFECAIFESKNNGAIAYVIPKKSLEQYKDNLQTREFFKDIEREHVEGPYPIQRLRLRRYLHIPTETEFLVPEKESYGQRGGGGALVRTVTEWCRSVQTQQIQKIKSNRLENSDFAFIGGSYFDTKSEKLLEDFLGTHISMGSKVVGYSEKSFAADDRQFIYDLGFYAQQALADNVLSVKRMSAANAPQITRLIELKSKAINLDHASEKKAEQVTAALNTDFKTYAEDSIKKYLSTIMNINDIDAFEIILPPDGYYRFFIELEYTMVQPEHHKITAQNAKEYKALQTLINLFMRQDYFLRVIQTSLAQDFVNIAKQQSQQQQALQEIRKRNLKLIKFRG